MSMTQLQTYAHNVNTLKSWGVEFEDLVNMVMNNQEKYIKSLTKKRVQHSINKVLRRSRVRHVLDVAETLDNHMYSINGRETRQEVLDDAGTFGLDETIALSICTSELARTNFGYVDKIKPGIIKEIDKMPFNTFKDDCVVAIVAESADQLAMRDVYGE